MANRMIGQFDEKTLEDLAKTSRGRKLVYLTFGCEDGRSLRTRCYLSREREGVYRLGVYQRVNGTLWYALENRKDPQA